MNDLLSIILTPRRQIKRDKAAQDKFLAATAHLDPRYSIKDRVELIKRNMVGGTCLECGAVTHWNSSLGRFNEYCSQQCRSASSAVREKRKATCRQKYGGNSPASSKDTVLKMQETVMQKYGVLNISSLSSTQDKIKDTYMRKYGVRHHLQRPDQLEKQKRTNMEKYGADSPLKLVTYAERVNHTRQHYSDELLHEISNNFENISSKHDPVFDTVKSASTVNKYISTYRPDLKTHSPVSKIETMIAEYMKSSGIVVERNRRDLIPPQEIDIFLPQYNVGIEVNGVYWHHDGRLDPLYHQKKVLRAHEAGIRLINYYDYQDLDRFLSFLGNKIQPTSKKLNARQCNVAIVDKRTERDFLTHNHIDGFAASSVAFGLYYQAELVMVASFRRGRFNNRAIELIRLASLKDHTVRGGVGKLIAHAQSVFPENIILSYSKLDWGVNHSLEKVGFIRTAISYPNYTWHKDGEWLTRYQTQKTKLPNLLFNKYSEDQSESKNMKTCGYLKLYDAGNEVFILSPKEN